MSQVKHSLLISGPINEDNLGLIEGCLDSGIKTILFSDIDAIRLIEEKYPEHHKYGILQTFQYDGPITLRISDGWLGGERASFEELSRCVSSFNSEQYTIEHSRNKNILVTASAGTGKTTVMIERVLYLLDVEEVDPGCITMITFTNEATNQMMSRLQDSLVIRFRLTGLSRYMELLERCSNINISTIDSFSYRLLRSLGQIRGYSDSLSISSNALAINEASMTLANDFYKPGKRVKECLGGNLHDVRSTTKDFYLRLASLGITGDHVTEMDWGTCNDGDSANLQSSLRKGISGLERCMDERRFQENTVALTDIVHELSNTLNAFTNKPDLDIRYLFIDEFQDTSYDQIKLVSDIAVKYGASLFVVGDPKQSIYRFRGADDSAFKTLLEELEDGNIEDVELYTLVNNYRTDEKVLRELNILFKTWSDEGLLAQFKPLVPCKGNLGGRKFIQRVKKESMPGHLCSDLRAALKDARKRRLEKGDDSKVVVLVRSNWQLDEVADICDRNKIPIVTRRDKPLYLSIAVRDLYAMMMSYLHPDDSVALLGYLETAYTRADISVSVDDLISANGNSMIVSEKLRDIISATGWDAYKSRFREEPALSVIKDMLADIPIIENYVSILKSRGFSDINILKVMARQYRSNLDKTLSLLHERFSGDGLDLSHICKFLSLSIATNRDELEEELDYSDLDVAYCMTIHKAKGLEFDTVIIPYDKRLFTNPQTEILVSSDKQSIGWMCVDGIKEGQDPLHNSLFGLLKKEDLERAAQEETRILYVAMTRAKRNLIAYTYWHKDEYSWSRLLER